MAVCWAWSRRGGGEDGLKSFASGFMSTVTSSRGGDSLGGESCMSSGAFGSSAARPSFRSRPDSRRRRACESAGATLRIWSRPTFLDDVISQLEERVSDRGVLIHVAGIGNSEHDSLASAIKYLRSLRRDRRQARLGDDDTMSSRSSTMGSPVRRRLRSAPVEFRVDVAFRGVDEVIPEVSSPAAEKKAEAAVDSKNVGSLADIQEESEKKVEAADDLQNVGSLSEEKAEAEKKAQEPTVAGGQARLDVDVVPSDDGSKLTGDERLRDLQLVLDAAEPQEFVGLAVVIGGERGTVKMHYSDRGFLVALDSGAEVSLARIEASHIADCLPKWAFGDA